MWKFIHDKLLKWFHGAEHYAAVAYSGCEVFELHHLIILVTAGLVVFGVGAIIYEWLEG